MHKLRRREQSSILERRSIWQLLYKPADSSYLCLCIFCVRVCKKKIKSRTLHSGRSRWPCRLRCRSAAARLLVSRVRIPLRIWMFASCISCVLCRQRPLQRADSSFREAPTGCVCVSVCDLETSQRRGLSHTSNAAPQKIKISRRSSYYSRNYCRRQSVNIRILSEQYVYTVRYKVRCYALIYLQKQWKLRVIHTKVWFLNSEVFKLFLPHAKLNLKTLCHENWLWLTDILSPQQLSQMASFK
jgi:hypothetical protein